MEREQMGCHAAIPWQADSLDAEGLQRAFPFQTQRRVGSYVHVSYDCRKYFRVPGSNPGELVPRRFRLFIYGAYRIGNRFAAEYNGICIFDLDQKLVLCDEIDRQTTGYFGPNEGQVKTFRWLLAHTWEEFQAFVNTHERKKASI